MNCDNTASCQICLLVPRITFEAAGNTGLYHILEERRRLVVYSCNGRLFSGFLLQGDKSCNSYSSPLLYMSHRVSANTDDYLPPCFTSTTRPHREVQGYRGSNEDFTNPSAGRLPSSALCIPYTVYCSRYETHATVGATLNFLGAPRSEELSRTSH